MEELPDPTLLHRDHQSRVLELPQVVHHGDAADLEVRGERADGDARFGAQQVEDAAAHGMSECVEDFGHIVERGDGRLTHMSKNIDM